MATPQRNLDISPTGGPMIRKIMAGVTALILVAILILAGNIWQNVNADEIVVIQSPLAGVLAWNTTPGIKWQGFGKVTTYRKRGSYPFQKQVRFNDGGHAIMQGSIQYEMPTDDANLTAIHVRFGSQEAVETQLIKTVVDKSVYMTGPLMSSKESYAEKRNALIWYVEDQVANGVYRTRQREERSKDPITGADKTITIVEIVEKDGHPLRAENAILAEFGIKPFNFSITEMPYDDIVEKQIAQQQQLAMQVQTAMAQSREAEQRALTAEKDGQARAMQAKWEQEAIKAREVTRAEQEKEVAETNANQRKIVAETEAAQKLEVARLDAQAAAQYKQSQLLRADGDATYKREVLAADGALAQKLATYEKVMEFWAQAWANYSGPVVPSVVMAGDGKTSTAGDAATAMLSVIGVRAAQQLALDMSMPDKTQTAARR